MTRSRWRLDQAVKTKRCPVFYCLGLWPVHCLPVFTGAPTLIRPPIDHKLAFLPQITDTCALERSGLPADLNEMFAMSRFVNVKPVLTGLCLAAAMVLGLAQAKAPAQVDAQAAISLAELPKQGVQVFSLIRQGGPFTSEKDGTVFGNRERLLPVQKRGYYREYTVPTPGLQHRGVKRIVCGGQPRLPDVCYYTADHYASFRQIVP